MTALFLGAKTVIPNALIVDSMLAWTTSPANKLASFLATAMIFNPTKVGVRTADTVCTIPSAPI